MMGRFSRDVLLGALLGCSFHGGLAHADESEPPAETLFREAKQLMADGHYAPACEKLAESERLDPASGTLLTLALCREGEGKTMTAWKTFQAAAELARHDAREDREAIAREHEKALGPKLSRLEIVLGSHEAGLVIKRDGVPLYEASPGDSAPLDPGDYDIEVTAPRRRPYRAVAHVEGPGVTVVTIPKLIPLPAPPAPELPAKIQAQRIGAYAVGGFGIATLGIGIGLGIHAKVSQDQANRICPASACGDQHAVNLNHDARVSADWATVSLVVGAAGLATATVLLLTAPKALSRKSAASAIRYDPSSVGFRW